MICGFQTVIAQPNNPQAGFGKNYFASVNAIVSDIQINGLRGTDQVSLDYYKRFLHFNGTITPELARGEYEASLQKDINVLDVIQKSGLSSTVKDELIKIAAVPETDGNRYYMQLANEILNLNIIKEEKNFLLQINDIAYAAVTNQGSIKTTLDGVANKRPCVAYGPDGSGYVSPAGCVIGAAVIGAATGFYYCGWVCAGVGAVVFGVVTAIAVC